MKLASLLLLNVGSLIVGAVLVTGAVSAVGLNASTSLSGGKMVSTAPAVGVSSSSGAGGVGVSQSSQPNTDASTAVGGAYTSGAPGTTTVTVRAPQIEFNALDGSTGNPGSGLPGVLGGPAGLPLPSSDSAMNALMINGRRGLGQNKLRIEVVPLSKLTGRTAQVMGNMAHLLQFHAEKRKSLLASLADVPGAIAALKHAGYDTGDLLAVTRSLTVAALFVADGNGRDVANAPSADHK